MDSRKISQHFIFCLIAALGNTIVARYQWILWSKLNMNTGEIIEELYGNMTDIAKETQIE